MQLETNAFSTTPARESTANGWREVTSAFVLEGVRGTQDEAPLLPGHARSWTVTKWLSKHSAGSLNERPVNI